MLQRRSRLYTLPKDILIKIIETIESDIKSEYQGKIEKFKEQIAADGEDVVICMGKDCLGYLDTYEIDWEDDLGTHNYRTCEDCSVKHNHKGRYLCEDCVEKDEDEETYGAYVMTLQLYNYGQNGPSVNRWNIWKCNECIKVQEYHKEVVYSAECGHVVWDGYVADTIKSSDPLHTKDDIYPLIKKCGECIRSCSVDGYAII